jgi:endoglucanase
MKQLKWRFLATIVLLYGSYASAQENPTGPRGNLVFDRIAATQLGFLPSSKKQFTSPVQFTSFTIRRTSDNATVYTGGGPLRAVSDQQGVLNGATVWVGDFSSFTTPGRYKIVVGNLESYPFDIRSDIFDQPLRATFRFFYYQRAFTAILQTHAEGPWYRPTDAHLAPAGVVKGWHDAGDLTVYNATMTQSLFWMLEAWSDFRPMDDNMNIPESGNGVPDLLDEARWGLEWLLSMQDPNGGFWCNATANNGTNSYPYGTTFPQSVNPYMKTVPPTVQATAKAIAVLGYAAGIFRSYDQAFANRCLAAARSGWTWMIANPNATYDGCGGCSGINFNSYAQGNDPHLLKTNRMWAAAGLLYATGETQYEAAFQQYYEPIGWISSFSKSEGFAASLYLRVPSGASQARKEEIRQRIFQMADGVRNDGNTHPFQFATHYYWGSCSNGMHRSGQFSWRAYLLDTTRTADRDQALFNLEWIFGRNYLNQCYLSGVNGVSKPRLRGFHHWMKALNANPWHFPGALAGGPNQSPDGNDISYPNHQPFPIWGYWGDPANPRNGSEPVEGRFTDNDSWSTNEVAINWNAALLYNLYAARKYARGGPSTAEEENVLPRDYWLEQNYPNPFNPTTTIRFGVPGSSHVRLAIYNILGQEVRTLADGTYERGFVEVTWDGRDNNGNLTSSGIYFYRMISGDFVETRKMILAR